MSVAETDVQYGSLVPVNGVHPEEELDLVCHLFRREMVPRSNKTLVPSKNGTRQQNGPHVSIKVAAVA